MSEQAIEVSDNLPRKSKPTRFRFSVTSLLVLFVVASIAFAWLREPVNQTIAESKLADKIEELGGKITWGGIIEGRGKNTRSYIGAIDLSSTKVTDDDLVEIGSLPELTHLYLNDTQVTDAGIEHLSSLKRIVQLELSGTKITNDASKDLSKLQTLEVLKLDRTQISDVALPQLAGLSKLWMLYLADTDITDDGLDELGGMANLRTLNIGAMAVTDVGLLKLRNMKQLEMLYLDGANVTKEGVEEFNNGLENPTAVMPSSIY